MPDLDHTSTPESPSNDQPAKPKLHIDPTQWYHLSKVSAPLAVRMLDQDNNLVGIYEYQHRIDDRRVFYKMRDNPLKQLILVAKETT